MPSADPRDCSSTGEPGAVKAARPVRRGADGKGLGNQHLAGGLPYFTSGSTGAAWGTVRLLAERPAPRRLPCPAMLPHRP